MTTPSSYGPHQDQHRSFSMLNDRAIRPPGSVDGAFIDSRPTPIEVDLTSARNLTPMAPPVSGNLDSYGDVQSMGNRRSPPGAIDNGVRLPGNYDLYNSLYSRDAPWDPISKTISVPKTDDVRGRMRQTASHYGSNGPAFTGYRGSTVPSECDTIAPGVLPSDSGYESRTRQSVGNPSVYGDVERSAETQSIIGPFGDFQLSPDYQSRDPNPGQDVWMHSGASQASSRAVDVDNNNLVCTWCKKPVKTKSELNKHTQRHTKPFRCQEQGCRRPEGFSTANDLDRHKRSCHPRAAAGGNRYKCILGPCRNKDKVWPRADNFRQHLRRVHHEDVSAEDDLEEYVYREAPMDTGELAGMVLSDTGFVSPGAVLPIHSPPSWLDMDHNRDVDHMDARSNSRIGQTEYQSAMDFQNNPDLVTTPQFSMMSSPDDCQGPTPEELRSMPQPALQLQHIFAPVSASGDPSRNHPGMGQQDPGMSDSCIPPNAMNTDSVPPADPMEPSSQLDRGPDDVTAPVDNKNIDMTSEVDVKLDTSSQDEAVSIAPADARPDRTVSSEDHTVLDAPLPAESTPASDDDSEESEREGDNDTSSSTKGKPSATSSDECFDSEDEDKARALFKALQQKGRLDKLLEELGCQKTRSSSASKAKKQSSATEQSQSDDAKQHPCTTCDKKFSRPCELKKHMKRHEKPYGCTFPQCSKKFGSKNDWKRHENSQHHQLEVWKCDEDTPNGSDEKCGKVCHRRETFKYHLQKDHTISDPKTVEAKLDHCRIGRNCEARFWCGFCEKIIEIKEKGVQAWTERFNHIDDHFSGRNVPKAKITEWKNVDQDLPAADFSSPKSDGTNSRGSPESSATPAVVAHGDDGVSSSGKRKFDSASNRRGAKKRKVERSVVWFCCQCQNMEFMSTTDICVKFDCNHTHCAGCKTVVEELHLSHQA